MYENGHRSRLRRHWASMARYHHVSVDYLLGITDIPNSLDGLHAKEQYILSYLPYLDEYMKDFIISIIRFDLILRSVVWMQSEERRGMKIYLLKKVRKKLPTSASI